MRRVEEQTGEQPGEYTVFDNLGAFALTAPAEFVDRLLVQPEIATATANYQEEDVFIAPKRVAWPAEPLHSRHRAMTRPQARH